MQKALRLYATAGVAVLGASLIYVTPVAAPHIEQRAVHLAAAETLSDLVGPIDAVVSTLTGTGGSALASVTDALTSGGGALSAEVSAALPSQAGLEILDPAFWQLFWSDLLDPSSGSSAELLLIGAIEQLPVIGPLLVSFGLFVVFPVSLLLADLWSLISQALGLSPASAAAEGLGTGLQGVFDSAVLDPTTLVQDLSTTLDPSAVTSILDSSAIAGLGTAFEPTVIADIGTLLDTSLIPDIGGMLPSLIP